MKIDIALILAGLLFAASRANAQIKVGTQQFVLDAGLANPLSNTDLGGGQSQRFGATGPAFGMGYLYQFQPNFSLGGDFNYKFQDTTDYSAPHGGVSLETSVWTMLAVGRADLLPQSRLRPYGLVGVGVGGARRSVTYAAAPWSNSERTSMGPAFALGGGVDYDLNSDWLIGAELRYSIIDTAINDVGTGSVSALDARLKIGYKFSPR